MDPIVIEKTQLKKTDKAGGYSVMVYDNETTPVNDVIGVFIVSCGYDDKKATEYTKLIQRYGMYECYWGSQDRCMEVISDFKKVGVRAELLTN